MTTFDANPADNPWLNTILRSANDAIITTDVGGTILSCNEPAEQMFGYGAAELVGKPIIVLFPPDRGCGPPSATGWRRDVDDRREPAGRHKDGQLVNVSMKIADVRDGHGIVIGLAYISMNPLERGRDYLLQGSRVEPAGDPRRIEIERVVSNLIHEVSESLTAINNYASGCRALAETPGQERLYAALKRITDLAGRTWRTTRRITDVVRGHDIRESDGEPPNVRW